MVASIPGVLNGRLIYLTFPSHVHIIWRSWARVPRQAFLFPQFRIYSRNKNKSGNGLRQVVEDADDL